MLCSVMYYDPLAKAFCGKAYTYYTKLPLKVFDAVLAPVGYKGEKKKAVVIDIDIPQESVPNDILKILKEIKETDE